MSSENKPAVSPTNQLTPSTPFPPTQVTPSSMYSITFAPPLNIDVVPTAIVAPTSLGVILFDSSELFESLSSVTVIFFV